MLHTYPSTYSTCILFDLITSTIQGIFCVQYKLQNKQRNNKCNFKKLWWISYGATLKS